MRGVLPRVIWTKVRDCAETWHRGTKVELGLLYGDPAEVFIKAAADASLLDVGASGQSATNHVMLGSVAAEVARRADCGVVVVRDNPQHAPLPDAHGPVAVGLDGSPGTAEVARYGFDVAARLKREVVLVHSWSDLPIPALPSFWAPQSIKSGWNVSRGRSSPNSPSGSPSRPIRS